MRTLYFLKDSVSGLFYTGQHCWLEQFQIAAIYSSEAGAKVAMNRIIEAWKRDDKEGIDVFGVRRRCHLKDWGIKIVFIIIDECNLVVPSKSKEIDLF